jgi:hypothetical protein
MINRITTAAADSKYLNDGLPTGNFHKFKRHSVSPVVNVSEMKKL